ncbi:hypothetical protein [Methylobacterium sp. GC_Met_2]|uniref:hypothetical protein n=1 Tax=Methylobacterium sp. GC_Met_2 TaxID=2937376 RepID=UPI00226BAF2B|nr:hypothetical protein [Methylobacterium sp. GC_Met_2]
MILPMIYIYTGNALIVFPNAGPMQARVLFVANSQAGIPGVRPFHEPVAGRLGEGDAIGIGGLHRTQAKHQNAADILARGPILWVHAEELLHAPAEPMRVGAVALDEG